jgi:hypothetical protein
MFAVMYGTVGDRMLYAITAPEDDAEVLRELAKYIRETASELPETDPLREAKLAQADRFAQRAEWRWALPPQQS